MKRRAVTGLRLILGYFGLFLMFEGILVLAPLITLIFYRNEWEVYLDFLIPSGISIVIGLTLFLVFIAGRERGRLRKRDDSLLLVLLWVAAIFLGAMPLYLTQFPALNHGNTALSLDMTLTECLFESTSGFTTTGVSTLPSKVYLDSVENALASGSEAYGAPHIFLFHRAWLQFVGGIGLVLLVTSLISSKNNLRLYFAEGHNDQVVPNLAKSAKLIFAVYAGWILVGSLGLWLSGMPYFEALCHSISAIATGGFSTRSTNIYYFFLQMPEGLISNGLYVVRNSIGIELISCILMIAGATNFLLHTFLIRFRFKDFFGDIEIKTCLCLLIFGTALLTVTTIYLYSGPTPIYGSSLTQSGLDWPTSLRWSFYLACTAISTTGFANFPAISYMGGFAVMVGFLLMTIGGGVGSTAGGIKQYRIAILFKKWGWSLKNKDSDNKVLNPNVIQRCGEQKEIADEDIGEARNYTLLALSFFAVGSLILLALPHHSEDYIYQYLYEFMNCFSSEGLTMVDYAAYKASPLTSWAYPIFLWVLIGAMFFGRLEIMPIIYTGQRIFVDPIYSLQKSLRRHARKKSAKET